MAIHISVRVAWRDGGWNGRRLKSAMKYYRQIEICSERMPV